MPGHAREGKMRSKLREAILAGFTPVSLDQVLNDNEMLRSNVALGPDFSTRVNSLIDVARQEGWLIELCGVLADARAGNQRVNSVMVAVQKWLIDQRDTNAVDLQFQHDVSPKPNHSFRYLPLLSIVIATAALIGVAAWVFVDKNEQTQPVISTNAPQSPVESDTKGKSNVQIDFGKSRPPMNAAAPPPMNAAAPSPNNAPPPMNAPSNADRPGIPKRAD